MVAYNESLPYDKALYAQDIAGSVAWARANQKAGILSAKEFSEIERGLQQVKEEWAANKFAIQPSDEDIHTANERRLGEIIGTDIGGKLHTGRSRNEQVVTDMRMWLRDQLRQIETWLEELLGVMSARAEEEIDHVFPGYTHLQRAQPVRWSHWMLSHGTNMAADLERLREVIVRVNKSGLGCGALAGNPFGVDREAIAKELGFDGILWNSMSAVADRDFVVESLQWGATLTSHLSRLAEDLIIYSTAEFGFVQLADAYSTGSSLMPQKKNPDSLELIRGKAGRMFGQMAGLMCTIKGLPTTYNKDLQESWEAMLDGVKTVGDTIRITTGVISTMDINPEKMLAALTPDMLATDIADYLVRKGVPFRETHHISGRVVALAEKERTPMDKLSFEQLQGVDSRFEQDIMECFNYEQSVERKNSKGGTSRASVLEQAQVIKATIRKS
jgi:argininosuccinate lyase